MPLLQKIIEHFQNLVLVSDTTMILMGVSIILMSVAYFYCVIFKKNKYEDIIVKIGILVRILMVVGFTIEFSHQKAVCEGVFMRGGDGKFKVVEQFSNYLFYGYIFVIGIYDIYTIGINKFRGFFHAFDLTMVSIPILYGVTQIILNFEFNGNILMGFLFTAYFMVLPYLFFKLFWKQNIKWYAIFLSYSSIFLLYVGVNLFTHKFFKIEMEWMSVPISYFLLGIYELCRHFFNKLRGTFAIPIWKKLKIVSIIVPVILVYSSIIALNFTPMQINKTYNVYSTYKEDANFTSVQEAEILARIAVEDTTSSINLWAGTSENFNNRYMFSIGNYSVQIDGATGKIFEIRTENEKEIDNKKTLSQEEIRLKTLKWLQNIGVTYDEKYLDMKVEKQSNKYTVKIFNKFNDGSIEDKSYSPMEWNIDGSIYSVSLGSTLFNIKDYKEIKVDENVIKENINKWYEKLGEKAPAYLLEGFHYFFGDSAPSINILCKNDDRFQINSQNGNVVYFYRDTRKVHDSNENNAKMTKEDYNKYKSKAEELVSLFSTKWTKYNLKLDNSHEYNENGNYEFKATNGALNYYIRIVLDQKGNMTSFNEGYDRANEYSDKDFKVSSSTALKLVSDKFKSFGIYTKRVKLAIEIKEDGEVNYKWMVMVIPFKTAEHQIYYVDTDTGEITSLLKYS